MRDKRTGAFKPFSKIPGLLAVVAAHLSPRLPLRFVAHVSAGTAGKWPTPDR